MGGVMQELKPANLRQLKDGTLIIVDKTIGTPQKHDPNKAIDWGAWVLPDGTWKQHSYYPQILNRQTSGPTRPNVRETQSGNPGFFSQPVPAPA